MSNHVLEFLKQRPLLIRHQLGIAYNIEKQNVSDLQMEMRLVRTRNVHPQARSCPIVATWQSNVECEPP